MEIQHVKKLQNWPFPESAISIDNHFTQVVRTGAQPPVLQILC